ncbi:MAG: tRNA (adenosine(37)-N6)-threonylcarbamoyltransferase complex transferase subunit TsaD [Candidatus Marinimicrobia bacterium]|nr:tRNA (adenosine(37)-N6)-threonylcarbamoyltransferase complex transferase subunit TsaD [Candidatus Neomarinimicrobiota bacterium]
MYILGIETSCDETSAAVSKDRNILSNTTVNQIVHTEYGGVVPEIASREHLVLIDKVVDKAIHESGIKIKDLKAVAVTNGPGLKGALMIGVNFAKGFSIANDIPIIGVNHMEGHLFANFIDSDNIRYPFLCMLVSGGHTQIWLVKGYQDYKLYSTTIDDAAGEAFDKGARMLGLNYPGGPEIEKLAKEGVIDRFSFPIAKIKESKFNFSFSGLKTSLYYLLKNKSSELSDSDKKDLAASYQEAILNALIQKLIYVSNETGVKHMVISGGVTANQRFRSKLSNLVNEDRSYEIIYPPIKYCTDNAAMICVSGYEKLINKQFSDITLDIYPNLLMSE